MNEKQESVPELSDDNWLLLDLYILDLCFLVDITEKLNQLNKNLQGQIKKMGTRNTVPGPDEVPRRVLSLTLGTLGHRLIQLFNSCMAADKIPKCRKTANLVLIPKPGKDLASPLAYRPICLLNEVRELFERVIAIKMHKHLAREGPHLADTQFGFRSGRSTIDTISRVVAKIKEITGQGGVALAISLDIVNAFNSTAIP